MPTPDLLPFDTLLAPIRDDAPTGDNPRRTAALADKFDKVSQAFITASRVAKQEDTADGGPTTTPVKLWGPVIAPATEFLTKQAKDMEVANFLAQALIRVNGLTGVRDGLRLLRELVERYWEGLHPLPGVDRDEEFPDEDDDRDDRILFVERLQALPILAALRLAPITDKKGDGPYSYADYTIATRAQLTTGNDSAAEEGRQRKSKIVAAATASGAEYYIRLLDDLDLAVGHMDALENLLMEKANSQGLILGKLRETLAEIGGAVRDISRGLIPEAAPPTDQTDSANNAGTSTQAASGGGGFSATGGNAARDRESALRCLSDIATFFKTTEPHSPVGYTLDTLIARARMPLPALLEDLISDSNAREVFLTTAGIRLPTPPS